MRVDRHVIAVGRDHVIPAFRQAIDKDLSDREDDQVETVTDYVDETCGLDF